MTRMGSLTGNLVTNMKTTMDELMDIETDIIISVLHDRMANMIDEERMALMLKLMYDYCTDCGRDTEHCACYCTRDD